MLLRNLPQEVLRDVVLRTTNHGTVADWVGTWFIAPLELSAVRDQLLRLLVPVLVVSAGRLLGLTASGHDAY